MTTINKIKTDLLTFGFSTGNRYISTMNQLIDNKAELFHLQEVLETLQQEIEQLIKASAEGVKFNDIRVLNAYNKINMVVMLMNDNTVLHDNRYLFPILAPMPCYELNPISKNKKLTYYPKHFSNLSYQTQRLILDIKIFLKPFSTLEHENNSSHYAKYGNYIEKICKELLALGVGETYIQSLLLIAHKTNKAEIAESLLDISFRIGTRFKIDSVEAEMKSFVISEKLKEFFRILT